MPFALEDTKKACPKPLTWLVIILACYCPASLSNGWEHTSIDLEVLVSALNDANPNLRRRAAESLGFRPQDKATAALLARLAEKEPVARVRQEIYHALGKTGDASALGAIGDCMDGETEIAVQAQCAAALANFRSPAAEKLALQAIQNANQHVRLRALASLGSFSSTTAVRALTEFIHDENESIRSTALLSLGRTGSQAAGLILLDLLQDSNQRKQILVLLQALIFLADPVALDTIQAIYRNNADEEIRRYALVAMASTRAKGSESYFLNALSSEDHASKILGLSVLRNLGSREQVAALVEHGLNESHDLFNRDSRQLLREPVQTLASLQILNEYLKTIIRLAPEAGQRLYAKAAQSRSITPTSSAALKIAEGFYDARWQAIYGLGYTGTARASELVAANLKDSDARIRAVAIRSMGVLGNPAHLNMIEASLLDEAAEVRWMAARVLGRLRAEDSVEAILLALDDSHAQVRLESTIALGYLRAGPARQKLSELAASDPDPRVQEAAVYAASLIR